MGEKKGESFKCSLAKETLEIKPDLADEFELCKDIIINWREVVKTNNSFVIFREGGSGAFGGPFLPVYTLPVPVSCCSWKHMDQAHQVYAFSCSHREPGIFQLAYGSNPWNARAF